jgi:hypothetical protein
MMVTRARTCQFPSGGVGEDIIAIPTAITADFAMAGIRGMGGGIGKQALLVHKLKKYLTLCAGLSILLPLW